MSDHENLKSVYAGTSVNANFIKSILTDNGINCLVRDTLMESNRAGWASGSAENACRVFVKEDNIELAKKLIEEYLRSNDED